jgi:hypothetical protein
MWWPGHFRKLEGYPTRLQRNLLENLVYPMSDRLREKISFLICIGIFFPITTQFINVKTNRYWRLLCIKHRYSVIHYWYCMLLSEFWIYTLRWNRGMPSRRVWRKFWHLLWLTLQVNQILKGRFQQIKKNKKRCRSSHAKTIRSNYQLIKTSRSARRNIKNIFDKGKSLLLICSWWRHFASVSFDFPKYPYDIKHITAFATAKLWSKKEKITVLSVSTPWILKSR